MGVAVAPDGDALRPAQRAIFVAAGVACVVAVLAGWLISCNAPTWVVTSHPHARLLVPALAPLLVGLTLPPGPRARRLVVTVAPVLAVVFIAWSTAMITTMH